MPIPELERRRVEQLLSKFCEERVPTHVRHKVRLLFRFTGNTALLIERRPHFQRIGEFTESIIAKFKFDSANHGWSLYWGAATTSSIYTKTQDGIGGLSICWRKLIGIQLASFGVIS